MNSLKSQIFIPFHVIRIQRFQFRLQPLTESWRLHWWWHLLAFPFHNHGDWHLWRAFQTRHWVCSYSGPVSARCWWTCPAGGYLSSTWPPYRSHTGDRWCQQGHHPELHTGHNLIHKIIDAIIYLYKGMWSGEGGYQISWGSSLIRKMTILTFKSAKTHVSVEKSHNLQI